MSLPLRQTAPDRRLLHSSSFLFPQVQSTVVPEPSQFFAPHLLSSPLPTNSFFQNFVLNNGDQPEYIHPYLIKSYQSSLTLCYPSLLDDPAYIYQVFISDLTVSTLDNPNPSSPHVVSSFSDLSVTLEHPSNDLQFFLVKGCPFLTCNVRTGVSISISTVHTILDLTPHMKSSNKYTLKLDNNQTWLIYASSTANFSRYSNQIILSNTYSGVIRIAALPDLKNPKFETVLDQFSSCYAVGGDAVFTRPNCLEYKWDTRGSGDLLMLAHPLHLQLLSDPDYSISLIEDFKYNSIDGELVGVVGDSWVLKCDPVSITWHSIGGIKEDAYPEIIEALIKDVEALDADAISTSSSYFYGKLIARAARLALIAEEVSYTNVIPAITTFLKEAIEPWMDGTLQDNGFLYDPKWGGLVTKQGSTDSEADFGFGIYNDHHYHLGYFIYSIAVLAKIDPPWGTKYKHQAYALLSDYMTTSRDPNSNHTRLRCFDLWKLHSWAAGLTEFQDGRGEESVSQALNAYYSAALLGLTYGDIDLVSIGSILSALSIHAGQTWWHVKEDATLYPQQFTEENRMVGVLWANKRDSSLWFSPKEWKECRLGIEAMPILPITEALFSDTDYVKQLVKWTVPALERDGVEEGWKGYVYALRGIYDKEGALANMRSLKGHDNGNSMSNLLWWVHRVGESGCI